MFQETQGVKRGVVDDSSPDMATEQISTTLGMNLHKDRGNNSKACDGNWSVDATKMGSGVHCNGSGNNSNLLVGQYIQGNCANPLLMYHAAKMVHNPPPMNPSQVLLGEK